MTIRELHYEWDVIKKKFLSLKSNLTKNIDNILHSFSCHHLYSKYLTFNNGSKLLGPIYLVVLEVIAKINKNYQAVQNHYSNRTMSKGSRKPIKKL